MIRTLRRRAAVINSVFLWQSLRQAKQRVVLQPSGALSMTSRLSLIGADNTHYSIQKRAQRVALASAASPQSPSDLAIALPSPELDSASKKLDDEEASLDMPEKKDEAPQPEPEQERRPEGMPMTSCIGRIGRPMFKLINRPWKVRSCVLSQSLQATDQDLDQQMYPIGVLFGIGFDTASEM